MVSSTGTLCLTIHHREHFLPAGGCLGSTGPDVMSFMSIDSKSQPAVQETTTTPREPTPPGRKAVSSKVQQGPDSPKSCGHGVACHLFLVSLGETLHKSSARARQTRTGGISRMCLLYFPSLSPSFIQGLSLCHYLDSLQVCNIYMPTRTRVTKRRRHSTGGKPA